MRHASSVFASLALVLLVASLVLVPRQQLLAQGTGGTTQPPACPSLNCHVSFPVIGPCKWVPLDGACADDSQCWTRAECMSCECNLVDDINLICDCTA